MRRPALRRALAARLRGSADLERLFGRAAAGLAAPAELAALARGLVAAAEPARLIREATLDQADNQADGATNGALTALTALGARLGPAPEAAARIAEALEERPAAEFGRGVVRAGVDAAIDRERAAAERGRERLAGAGAGRCARRAELRRCGSAITARSAIRSS